MSNNKSWSALTFETPFIQLFTPSLRVHMFRIGWKKYSDEVSEPSCGHYNIFFFFDKKEFFRNKIMKIPWFWVFVVKGQNTFDGFARHFNVL